MKPFDDMLPEEQEEQHRELITLLHQAYRQSLASTASAQEQAIQRVGERLAMMEDNVALSGGWPADWRINRAFYKPVAIDDSRASRYASNRACRGRRTGNVSEYDAGPVLFE